MNWLFLVLSSMGFVVGFVSCHSTAPIKSEISSEKTPWNLRRLPIEGNNVNAVFSSDGRRLLYQSSGRLPHSGFQVYEYDLDANSERRITFQDGDAFDPQYSPDGNLILYSSTTDEIKESLQIEKRAELLIQSGNLNPPEYPRNTLNHLLDISVPTELYLSKLDGSQIRRVTKIPGFEGDAVFSPNGQSILFLSNREKMVALIELSLAGRHIVRHQKFESDHFARAASFSPDGESLVWSQSTNPNWTEAQLVRSKKDFSHRENLTPPGAADLFPSWFPDNKKIVFSSNRKAKNLFEIYSLDLENSCVQQISDLHSQIFYPRISPDGHSVVFSVLEQTRFQIYLLSIPPNIPCDPLPRQASL